MLSHATASSGRRPAPIPPLQPGEKLKRPQFLTNVRNTNSGHWRPWLQGAEVTFGPHRGGRCIVPARAFAEPDRNTSKPVINRWSARRDGKPWRPSLDPFER